ncbi:MAG: hypothetical protein A2W25_08140 [candidate division Zixibacteria bacterium RBG_16_53_22]|nr:MAG: hypothetical protein A2W25_08140 [candidate division Zixibacteria bacterium RBG_16_53_22]
MVQEIESWPLSSTIILYRNRSGPLKRKQLIDEIREPRENYSRPIPQGRHVIYPAAPNRSPEAGLAAAEMLSAIACGREEFAGIRGHIKACKQFV